MKIMFRKSIYTRTFGVEIGNHAAFEDDKFYKILVWINLWSRVLAIFLFKEKFS